MLRSTATVCQTQIDSEASGINQKWGDQTKKRGGGGRKESKKKRREDDEVGNRGGAEETEKRRRVSPVEQNQD